jgi:hypothetical protein
MTKSRRDPHASSEPSRPRWRCPGPVSWAWLTPSFILACSAGSTDSQPPPVFRTGDAFTLEFTLPEPAYATLLHVGPRGDLSIVYPEEATTPRREIPSGERVQLPDTAAGSEWVFEGDPGWETFLLLTNDAPSLDLSEILTARDPLVASGPSRAELVSSIRRRLARVGTVELVEVLHLP